MDLSFIVEITKVENGFLIYDKSGKSKHIASSPKEVTDIISGLLDFHLKGDE